METYIRKADKGGYFEDSVKILQNKIKMCIREIYCEDKKWIELAQDRGFAVLNRRFLLSVSGLRWLQTQ